MTYYMAIDIGASSGRHILGHLDGGKLILEEVYRFPNGLTQKDGHLCWDTHRLFEEILTGLSRCQSLGKIPQSLGIDAWGVDYVLLDEEGRQLGDAFAYRDSRTRGMNQVLSRYVDEWEVYTRVGMNSNPVNTIYQMLSVQERQPALLRRAKGFLMMPDYFSYLLTGVKAHEYTIASTTGMVNAKSRNWDWETIGKIGLPQHLFGEIKAPGTVLGPLSRAVAQRVGFGCQVVLTCAHDTASAVVSAPIDANSIYLSSGTWSLIGVETMEPICTPETHKGHLTNEGGYQSRYRFLKNIMGLWLMQKVKEEWGEGYSFDRLAAMARQASHFPSRIDVDDPRFLAPESMTGEIQAACAGSGQEVPQTVGEVAACVYHSLADSYRQAVKELEIHTGRTYDRICIVGGGSQNTYLNELTAKRCGKKVTAGPGEATAAGNILVQMIGAGELADLDAARAVVKQSFSLTEYEKPGKPMAKGGPTD